MIREGQKRYRLESGRILTEHHATWTPGAGSSVDYWMEADTIAEALSTAERAEIAQEMVAMWEHWSQTGECGAASDDTLPSAHAPVVFHCGLVMQAIVDDLHWRAAVERASIWPDQIAAVVSVLVQYGYGTKLVDYIIARIDSRRITPDKHAVNLYGVHR